MKNRKTFKLCMKRVSVSVLFVIMLIGFCFNAISCTKAVDEEDKINAVKAFVTEFCTFNKNDRYNKFKDTLLSLYSESNSEVFEKKQNEAYEKYLEIFSDMITEECLDTMAANRYPAVFDEMVADKNLVAEIDGLNCTFIRENVYDFEVTFKSEEVNELLNASVKGQIEIKIVDNRVYVDSIYLYS